MSNLFILAYLFSGVCFILALKGLASPKSARSGNMLGILGMGVAIYTTLYLSDFINLPLILSLIAAGGIMGGLIAISIPMTAMPQLVAAFHSLVGLAAVLVAASAFYAPESFEIIDSTGKIALSSIIEMSIGTVIGAITFTGSVIAFGKLQGLLGSKAIRFTGQHLLNALLAASTIALIVYFCDHQEAHIFWLIAGLGFLLGILLIIPIGGADMPVVVSMLNSYSGWAAAGIGFTLNNILLIITGALVGASGAILSYIMCKAMNRSIFNVIFGGFGDNSNQVQANHDDRPIKSGNAEDAAFMFEQASTVIIVPGYGMAVSQAQHAVRELVELLQKKHIDVRFAIHPVAGRMPGHMNVLLAEANIPYDQVFELDEINHEFATTDIVYVIGANDITNPAAKTDKSSPIYGMPILNVDKAQQVLFVKRSMSAGYAGIQNDLFFQENTTMLFGDAKKMTEDIVKSMDN